MLGGRLAQRQAALREVVAVCHGQLRSVLAVQIESTPRATNFSALPGNNFWRNMGISYFYFLQRRTRADERSGRP
jgi:hypothetical protein